MMVLDRRTDRQADTHIVMSEYESSLEEHTFIKKRITPVLL